MLYEELYFSSTLVRMPNVAETGSTYEADSAPDQRGAKDRRLLSRAVQPFPGPPQKSGRALPKSSMLVKSWVTPPAMVSPEIGLTYASQFRGSRAVSSSPLSGMGRFGSTAE